MVSELFPNTNDYGFRLFSTAALIALGLYPLMIVPSTSISGTPVGPPPLTLELSPQRPGGEISLLEQNFIDKKVRCSKSEVQCLNSSSLQLGIPGLQGYILRVRFPGP